MLVLVYFLLVNARLKHLDLTGKEQVYIMTLVMDPFHLGVSIRQHAGNQFHNTRTPTQLAITPLSIALQQLNVADVHL